MFYEDDDIGGETAAPVTVDTSSVLASAPVAESAPVVESSSGGGGIAEPVDTPEPSVGAAKAVKTSESSREAESPWNGELAGLDSLDDFKTLPTTTQRALRGGLERIRKSMDRAFHDKMAAVSQKARNLEEREKLINRLGSDYDGTVDELISARLDERTAELRAELEAARSNRADPEELTSIRAQLDAIKAEKEDLESRYREADTEVQKWRETQVEAQKAALDEEVDKVFKFLEAKAPDVLANDDALRRFLNDEDAFKDYDAALAVVRIKFPAPVSKAPVAKPAVPAKVAPKVFDLEETERATAEPGEGRRRESLSSLQDDLRRQRREAAGH